MSMWSEDAGTISRRLRDYASLGKNLLVQRLVLCTLAVALSAAYYSIPLAALFYGLILLCEVYDHTVFSDILKVKKWSRECAEKHLLRIYIGTATSSVVIALFAVFLTIVHEGQADHFFPLFLLISASIFSAVNNRQFLGVVLIRVSIYFLAILFIPLREVWLMGGALSSAPWLHLFTVIFVLAFIVECARSFLSGYDAYLRGRRRLEAEHNRTRKAYEAKTRFLATVSHELRTPLTSICGFLEIVNSGALGAVPDKALHPLEVATRNSRRLAELIDDLLYLQKLDHGAYDFNFEVVSVREIVLDTCERFAPFASKTRASVRCEFPETNLWVRADAKRLDQVVMNILSNAAKFSADGVPPMISISLKEESGFVRISISDNGIGISRENRHSVFDAFSQIDSSNQRCYQGTGLGLSISKKIVEAHGGNISFDSNVGCGTTFHIDIPSVRNPVMVDAAA